MSSGAGKKAAMFEAANVKDDSASASRRKELEGLSTGASAKRNMFEKQAEPKGDGKPVKAKKETAEQMIEVCNEIVVLRFIQSCLLLEDEKRSSFVERKQGREVPCSKA